MSELKKRRYGALALFGAAALPVPAQATLHDDLEASSAAAPEPRRYLTAFNCAGQRVPIRGSAFAVVDPENGEILAEDNIDREIVPASAIKLLVTIAVYEAVAEGKMSFDDIIPVTRDARSWAYGNRISGFSSFSVRDGVALLVDSKNDAAGALAHAVTRANGIEPTKENVLAFLNDFAEKIGASDTYVSNPSGMPLPDRRNDPMRTTARDMMTMAYYTQQHYPEIFDVFDQASVRVRGRTFYSTYGVHEPEDLPGTRIKIKTGTGCEAGSVAVGGVDGPQGRLLIGVFGAVNGAARLREIKAAYERGLYVRATDESNAQWESIVAQIGGRHSDDEQQPARRNLFHQERDYIVLPSSALPLSFEIESEPLIVAQDFQKQLEDIVVSAPEVPH